MTDPRRRIPAVESLLDVAELAPLLTDYGRPEVVRALREIQSELRAELAGSPADPPPERVGDPAWYAERIRDRLERRARPSLGRVINATGVVLHTNLGRAPLANAARRAVAEAAGYAALEYDVETGGRGARHDHCVALLRESTGAEDALVVNNNAGAVVLALHTLAAGRPAVISRGELVEIGGSFRIPEIMDRSGARMREVGATNRTHPRDYRAALDGAAAVLKVHRSNFRVEGFTAEVSAAELASLAHGAGVPLIHDLGSGALLDMRRLGLPPEPTARDAIDDGADVVTMSGDKLLGGPQAGIILGRSELMERIRSTPLYRALRPDKLTLAALEATLRLYRDPDRAAREIPVLRMLGAPAAELRDRAERLARRLTDAGIATEAVPAEDGVGGGAYPGVRLAGSAITPALDAESTSRRLRQRAPAVVGRIHDGRLLLHVRTVATGEEDELVAAVVAAREGGDGGG